MHFLKPIQLFTLQIVQINHALTIKSSFHHSIALSPGHSKILSRCEIKSWSGLGMRLTIVYILYWITVILLLWWELFPKLTIYTFNIQAQRERLLLHNLLEVNFMKSYKKFQKSNLLELWDFFQLYSNMIFALPTSSSSLSIILVLITYRCHSVLSTKMFKQVQQVCTECNSINMFTTTANWVMWSLVMLFF